MRTFKTEGIIIKRRNFGEADRILTVFTKINGKILVKAKGVRKITSRRSSHIEPLNLSLLSLYQARNIPILTEVQTIQSFNEIKTSLMKVGFSYHICELVDGLCAENESNLLVFELLKNTLKRLSEENKIVEIIHEFEIELLTTLGFFPKKNYPNFNTSSYIEQILEKKLKSKQIIDKLIS